MKRNPFRFHMPVRRTPSRFHMDNIPVRTPSRFHMDNNNMPYNFFLDSESSVKKDGKRRRKSKRKSKKKHSK